MSQLAKHATPHEKLKYSIQIGQSIIDLQHIDCLSPYKNAGKKERKINSKLISSVCNATILHNDISSTNFLVMSASNNKRFTDSASKCIIDDREEHNSIEEEEEKVVKLADFNEGRLLYWNPETNQPCGYRNPYTCGGNGQRLDVQSPEECLQHEPIEYPKQSSNIDSVKNNTIVSDISPLLDEKVDTFGLGSALFMLLTSTRPFRTFNEQKEEIMSDEEKRSAILQNVQPDYPAEILNIISPKDNVYKKTPEEKAKKVDKRSDEIYVQSIMDAVSSARTYDASKRPSALKIVYEMQKVWLSSKFENSP